MGSPRHRPAPLLQQKTRSEKACARRAHVVTRVLHRWPRRPSPSDSASGRRASPYTRTVVHKISRVTRDVRLLPCLPWRCSEVTWAARSRLLGCLTEVVQPRRRGAGVPVGIRRGAGVPVGIRRAPTVPLQLRPVLSDRRGSLHALHVLASRWSCPAHPPQPSVLPKEVADGDV